MITTIKEYKLFLNENNLLQYPILTGKDASDYLEKMGDSLYPSEVGLQPAVGYYLLQKNPEKWIAFESIDGIIVEDFDNEEDAKEYATLVLKK